MPNPTDLHDDDIDPEDDEMPDPQPAAETPRDLRRAAADGKAARAEATRLARENAMLKAGIDTDSPVGALFAKGYEGELTKEAVKAAWSALGLASPAAEPAPADPPADPDVTLEEGEADLTGHRQALANGAAGDTPATPDAKAAAKVRFDAVVNAGGGMEDAMAASIETLIDAYNKGDNSVVVEAYR